MRCIQDTNAEHPALNKHAHTILFCNFESCQTKKNYLPESSNSLFIVKACSLKSLSFDLGFYINAHVSQRLRHGIR